MPANREERPEGISANHDAEELYLARLCHPSIRIAEHLLEPLGLNAWPKPRPRVKHAEPFEAEAGCILPSQ